MADFEIENVNPEDLYSNKELQDNYTKLSIGGETVAVIVPFHKSQAPQQNDKVVNISELIREEESNNELPNEEEPTENKERGDFRKRLFEKGHSVDVIDEGGKVYTDSSFEITTIEKVAEEKTYPDERFKEIQSGIVDEIGQLQHNLESVNTEPFALYSIVQNGLLEELEELHTKLDEMNTKIVRSLRMGDYG